jgi:hypothetical protein
MKTLIVSANVCKKRVASGKRNEGPGNIARKEPSIKIQQLTQPAEMKIAAFIIFA